MLIKKSHRVSSAELSLWDIDRLVMMVATAAKVPQRCLEWVERAKPCIGKDCHTQQNVRQKDIIDLLGEGYRGDDNLKHRAPGINSECTNSNIGAFVELSQDSCERKSNKDCPNSIKWRIEVNELHDRPGHGEDESVRHIWLMSGGLELPRESRVWFYIIYITLISICRVSEIVLVKVNYSWRI